MVSVYLNRIATAVPDYDIHAVFVAHALSQFTEPRQRAVFQRMVERAQIDQRYSVLPPPLTAEALDGDDFYAAAGFPATARRMAAYQNYAFPLAQRAIDKLQIEPAAITHVIVTSCTGFYAPGLDIDIIKHYGLRPTVERTLIGFMGCYAALNALKSAQHIVRSQPGAQVLIVNLELCSLHLQNTPDIETLLSFLIFADGCAASLVSAQPTGLELQSFHSVLLPDTQEQITWQIGDQGFDMILSGQVPASIAAHLPAIMPDILNGQAIDTLRHWAVHPGGRSILDHVQDSLHLSPRGLDVSRQILRRYGNMSSATLMFVLQEMLANAAPGAGCAMAFGPGVMLESLLFNVMATS